MRQHNYHAKRLFLLSTFVIVALVISGAHAFAMSGIAGSISADGTRLYQGASTQTAVVDTLNAGQSIMVQARNDDNTWVFVKKATPLGGFGNGLGNGWTRIGNVTVNTAELQMLPVWDNPMDLNGDGRARPSEGVAGNGGVSSGSGTSGGGAASTGNGSGGNGSGGASAGNGIGAGTPSINPWVTVVNQTNLYAGPAPVYRVISTVPPGTSVKVLARNSNGFWAFIWSDFGDGWVPRSQISGFNPAGVPIWDNAIID